MPSKWSRNTESKYTLIKWHLKVVCFFFFKEFFDDTIDDDKYCGNVFGLGNAYPNNGNGYNTLETSQ